MPRPNIPLSFVLILLSVGQSLAIEGDLTGRLEQRFGIRANANTPSENPSTELMLNPSISFSRDIRVKSEIKMVYDGSILHTQTDSSPLLKPFLVFKQQPGYLDVNELYLDFFFKDFDVRIGKQKINWGVLDEYQPTDVFNPEDYSRFMELPEADRKIGIPALRIDAYSLPVFELEWVFAPVFFPYRLSSPGNRFFPPMLDIAKDLRAYFQRDPFLSGFSIHQDLMGWGWEKALSSFSTGLRLSNHVAGFDTHLYYFTGLDPIPVYSSDVHATTRLFPSQSLYRSLIDLDIYPTSRRMHMFGADLTRSLGNTTVRFEWAFFHGRPYNRDTYRDLEGPFWQNPYAYQLVRGGVDALLDEHSLESRTKIDIPDIVMKKDNISWGIGLDYILPKRMLLIPSGSFLTAQFTQDVILSHGHNLVSEPSTHRVSIGLRSSFRNGTIEFNPQGAYQIENKSYLGSLEVIYKYKPSLQLVGTYFFVGGDPSDTIGEFRGLDEAILSVRYLF
jgi:hypothetical protein